MRDEAHDQTRGASSPRTPALETDRPPPREAARPTLPTIWWMAVRPRTLTASMVPVVVGSAVALRQNAFDAGVFSMCLVAALALQVATNLANDAFDYIHAIDTAERRGPTRATQAGWLTPRQVLLATEAAIAVAVLAGGYLVFVGGLPILVLGLASIAGALLYSAGPYPLASHGLGEVAAFVFFGLVAVCGSAYLHLGAGSALALLCALPVGALVSAIMLVNNVRDIDSDAKSGKRTLAVRLGARRATRLYASVVASAYVALALPIGAGVAGPTAALPLLSAPLGLHAVRALWRARTAPEFDLALAGSARLHLVFGLLLALGIAL